MGNANNCCASSTGNEKPETTVADPAPVQDQIDKALEQKPDQGPQVVLRFVLQNGTSKDVTFTERPLGIDFSRTLPLTCKRLKPGLQGEKNEVKIGWCVSHINGTVIQTNFDEALRDLQDAVKQLPAV
mmetsp:Transcript_28468/g.45965  ORF Transcript_28468/g.45965 Transcript_28468/m.45965 type:complete len:128 (-) Transcript_28468:132-515(-)